MAVAETKIELLKKFNIDFDPAIFDDLSDECFKLEHVKEVKKVVLEERKVVPSKKCRIKLLAKYFQFWKEFIYQKKHRLEKVDDFIKRLKEKRKEVVPSNNNKQQNVQKQVSNYQNRFEAQKDIIALQKLKLEKQNKIIETLKLGIITQDLAKSLEMTKSEFREIFRNSINLKQKAAPLLDDLPKRTLNLEIKTEKVPKLVIEMEKRAQERALKRQIIMERKRIIDKEKKQMAELILEQKRIRDEEERKRNLEILKQKRRIEMELERIRQINRQKYMNDLRKAQNFYQKRLKSRMFNRFLLNIEKKHDSIVKSKEFYCISLIKKSYCKWLLFKQEIERKRFKKAILLHRKTVLRKHLGLFKLLIFKSKQSLQVAHDLFDFRLQSRSFIHWHRYVCKIQMKELKNLARAKKHYDSHVLVQYFYQWKTLPAVLQLEKAKEAKKRKWREKVWEILPDFKPFYEDL